MKESTLEILEKAKVKETIDIFYINEYIAEREYLAAMKFRWLYAQTFGSSQIKANNYMKIKGRDVGKKEVLSEKHAKDFQFVRDFLIKENCYQLVFDICILNKSIPQDQISYYISTLPGALVTLDKSFGELNIQRFKMLRH